MIGKEKLGAHSSWGKGKEERAPSNYYVLYAYIFMCQAAGGYALIPNRC